MYYSLINSMKRGVGYTARTTAFATATGITDVTILGALNTFDLGLISNSLDTKMKAVYPMVGGTSTTQKYNFMDARDLDVAFRLQFNGGWTFSSTGAKPNGSNAYANTFLNPSSNLTNNNYHLSNYSRTQVTNTFSAEMSVSYFSTNIGLLQYYSSGGFYPTGKVFLAGDYITTLITAADTNTLGLLVGSRTSQTSAKMFMNNVQKGSTLTTSNANALPNGNLFLAANNGGGSPNTYSSKENAFSSVGDALTDGEATTFYNLVQAMQTSLSRNV